MSNFLIHGKIQTLVLHIYVALHVLFQKMGWEIMSLLKTNLLNQIKTYYILLRNGTHGFGV